MSSAFVFKSYAYDRKTGTLSLRYGFDHGPEFEETVVFPKSSRTLDSIDEKALDEAFRLIFLLAGVSYYKAYIPEALRCEAFPLSAPMAAFIENVYRQGLGEFAFRNDVTVNPYFEKSEATAPEAIPLNLRSHALVAVGGGKDSIVTIETLKAARQPMTLFAVGTEMGLATPIKNTIDISGVPSLVVKRTISKNLLDLNRQGALNGHIPITSIVSAIAVAAALLHGIDTVVFSNEHSASAPSLKVGGMDVNHQYSKSLAFEKDFARLLAAHLTSSLAYFSLLRPLSEVAIARRFAPLEKYHQAFRSCNTAFRQDETLRGKNWCCNCPKCRFVFLALAPFMDKGKLTSIFGKNLLSDSSQIDGYKELCGLSAFKPFECVGEIEESALLMQKLYCSPVWAGDPVVKEIGPVLSSKASNFDARFEALFSNHPDHRVPDKYVGFLNACRGS